MKLFPTLLIYISGDENIFVRCSSKFQDTDTQIDNLIASPLSTSLEFFAHVIASKNVSFCSFTLIDSISMMSNRTLAHCEFSSENSF